MKEWYYFLVRYLVHTVNLKLVTELMLNVYLNSNTNNNYTNHLDKSSAATVKEGRDVCSFMSRNHENICLKI